MASMVAATLSKCCDLLGEDKSAFASRCTTRSRGSQSPRWLLVRLARKDSAPFDDNALDGLITRRIGRCCTGRITGDHGRKRNFGQRGREGGCGPGGDLLFRTLRCSTIGAEGFHGRVRDGIGCLAPRYGHQAGKGFVM
jgi:hypothetical protein